MSTNDRCAVRRCRHPRSAHVPETVNYISIGGFPASFEAHGACTQAGCTCKQFSMVNSLQPTRPCKRCGEEFLAEGNKRVCPDCYGERSGEPADVFTAFNRFARDYVAAAQESTS